MLLAGRSNLAQTTSTMKNLFRRKARLDSEPAAHQKQLIRAIGELDPFAEADPYEVEERLRRITHGSHRRHLAADL